jgi:hypothetical protein
MHAICHPFLHAVVIASAMCVSGCTTRQAQRPYTERQELGKSGPDAAQLLTRIAGISARHAQVHFWELTPEVFSTSLRASERARLEDALRSSCVAAPYRELDRGLEWGCGHIGVLRITAASREAFEITITELGFSFAPTAVEGMMFRSEPLMQLVHELFLRTVQQMRAREDGVRLSLKAMAERMARESRTPATPQ